MHMSAPCQLSCRPISRSPVITRVHYFTHGAASPACAAQEGAFERLSDVFRSTLVPFSSRPTLINNNNCIPSMVCEASGGRGGVMGFLPHNWLL